MARKGSQRRATGLRNRRMLFETLESRRVLAAAWRNPVDALDVTQDQRISPLDALVVVNDLNRRGARELEAARGSTEAPFYDVSGDGRITALDALRLVNALNRGRIGGYALREGNMAASELAVTIGLGQPEGSRSYRFTVDADFDTSDSNSIAEDTLAVYLRDPLDPTNTLLAGGRAGAPLFTLSGSRAEYVAGTVRFDGRVVEIDLTEIEGAEASELVFQLINSDNDSGSVITLHSFANEVDPEGTASTPVVPGGEIVAAAGTLDTASMTSSDQLMLDVASIQFDRSQGVYRAAVRAQNLSEAVGRDVAVVLTGLPEGVTLRNRSGTNAAGQPYLNLREAIPAGGLGRNARSGYVELIIESPNLQPFSLDAEVLLGQPNRGPTLQPIAPLTVMAGDVVEVSLDAVDPDGDRLQFGLTPAESMPTTQLRNDGTLVFAPSPDQVGTYQFMVSARDGLQRVEQMINLTVVADPLTSTRVSGRVLDVDGTPLVGMLVEIGAIQGLTTSDGSFTLDLGSSALVSDTLKIRGDQFPGEGVAYPFIAERLPLLLEHGIFNGTKNVIPRPIYLPKLDVAGGSIVDPATDTTVAQEFAPGEMASIFVEAGTLMNLQGTPFDGVLSITEVPPTLTPAALPKNMLVDTVVTIQPGEMVFSTPAPLTLPNRAGWAPGTLMDLMSINPTTGEFDKAGRGRVSADGSVIETIEDGIRNSSWHFFTPDPPTPQDPDQNPRNEDPECKPCSASRDFTSDVQLHSGVVVESHALATYQSLGVSRGVQLTYDSMRADPRPIVHSGYNGVTQSDSQRLVARLTLQRDGLRMAVPGYEAQERPAGVPERIHLAGNFTEPVAQGTIPDWSEYVYQFSANEGQYLAIENVRSFGDPSIHQIQVTVTAPDGSVLQQRSAEPFFVPQTGTYTVTVTPLYDPLFHPSVGFSLDLVDVSHLNLSGGEHFYAVRDGDNDIAMQADMSGLPSGKYSYTLNTGLLQLTEAGFTGTMSPSRGDIYHVNSVSSPVGAGWGIGGLQEIIENPDGSLMLIDGDGSELIYKPPASVGAPYQSQPGDFSVLERVAEGTFRRTMHDQTIYIFNSENRLASITDRNGNRTEYVYDTGDLIKIIDPVGLETRFHYEGGKLARVVDPAGRTTILEHDADGNLIRITDPNGSSRTFAYDGGHHLTVETDQRGNREETVYGFHGRATRAVRKDGSEILVQPVQVEGLLSPERTTDPLNPPRSAQLGVAEVRYVDANGNVHRTLLDQRGQAVASFDSLGPLPASQRDVESNLLTTHSDARGNTTRFTYDAQGNLLNVSDAISLASAGGTFESDLTPHSVLLADVNGDGREDSIATGTDEFGSSLVVVLLGEGNGGFAAPLRFAVGDGADGLAVGDLNGDGAADIVSANPGGSDSSVTVLLGEGDGSFGERVDYAVGADPKTLQLADMDSDGVLDIVTANSEGNSISVLLGRGDGSFPGPIARTGQGPIAHLSADLNGDGVLDVITANASDDAVPGASLSVLIGGGDGSFTTSEVLLNIEAGSLRGLAAGDLDGDGVLDIIAVDDVDDGGLSVLLGSGNGGLTLTGRVSLDGWDPTTVALADMNGDSAADAVVGSAGTLMVLLGGGDGTFAAPVVKQSVWVEFLTLGDVDGDGAVDAVIADEFDDSVTVLSGNGDGTFGDSTFVPAGGTIRSLELLDVDGNGTLDIAGNLSAGGFFGATVLLGTGDGIFSRPAVEEPTTLSEDVGDTLSAAHIVELPHDSDVRLQASLGDNSFASSEVDLYRVELAAGEGLALKIAAQSIGLSSLDSILRVFDGSGHELAVNDDASSLDAVLRFEAPSDGSYYIGVSGFANFDYDPTVAGSGDGWSSGDYQITLSRRESLPSGTQRTAYGDVDGNGTIDAVTFAEGNVWYESSSLWFEAGNANGTFAAAVETRLEVSLAVEAFSLADLDGDGVLDVLGSWNLGNRIVLLAGDTAGNFDAFDPRAADTPVGERPQALTVGDLDGDGTPDLVTGNSGSVSVLIGQGGGGFAAAVELAVTEEAADVALGDFDGDGNLDLVAALEDVNRIAVFLANGDGSFAPRDEYAAGDEPIAVSLLDSDADGDLDVVTANEEDASVSVLRNNGDGTFPGLVFHTGGSPQSVASGDVNGDGVPDLVTADEEGTVSVLLGSGGGGYRLAASYSVGQDTRPASVVLADVNRDGRVDVVATGTYEFGAGFAAVLLGQGDGSFGSAVHFDVGVRANAVAVGDVNGDGNPDVVTVNSDSYDSSASVLIGRGDGSFGGRVDYAVGPSPESLDLVDQDRDGVLDIITANTEGGSVSVLAGRGDGTFAGPIARTGLGPTAHVTADLNGDGVLDLVTANSFDGALAGRSLSVLIGRGDGSFKTAAAVPLELAEGSLRGLAAGDLNGDGAIDVLALHDSRGGGLSVLLGSGDGGLTATGRVALNASDPAVVSLADMDGDGTTDAVVGTGSEIMVLLGEGDGTFAAPLVEQNGWGDYLALEDINGDGRIDVIAASAFDHGAYVWLGDTESGTFSDATFVPLGGRLQALKLVDLDANGTLDIVANIRSAGLLGTTVRLGAGDGTFTQPTEEVTTLSEEIGDELTTSYVVELPQAGTVQLQSSIGDDGLGSSDVDLFRVELAAGEGIAAELSDAGGADAILRVFDNRGVEEGFFDDTSVRFTASADGIYYIGISGFANSDYDPVVSGSGSDGFTTGDYQLTLSRLPSLPSVFQKTAVGDLNGDGAPDAVTFAPNDWSNEGSSLWFEAGQGDGTLAAPVQTRFENTLEVEDISLADVDGDGDLDVLGSWISGNRIVLLAGDGAGNFVEFDPRAADTPVDGWPRAVLASDLDGDGIPDLVTGNYGSVSVLMGQPDGTFAASIELVVSGDAEAVALGDLNGDGLSDIVAALADMNRFAVFLADGAGDFSTRREYAVGDDPESLLLLDSDGDGDLDVIAANEDDASLSVLRNDGDGTFPDLVAHTGEYPHSVAAGDVNGDGVGDLVTANGGDATVSVLLGQPLGGYQAATNYPVGEDVIPMSVVLADVDQDGRVDIVAAGSIDFWSGTVAVLLGNANGTFGTAANFVVGNSADALAMGDLNSDGMLDVVTANRAYLDASVTVLLGKGDGSFEGRVDYAVGLEPASLQIADLDGDGILDIVTANEDGDSVSVLRGRGDGTFPGRIARTGDQPLDHLTADLNGDGVLDVVTANRSYQSAEGSNLSVLIGRGDGHFDSTAISLGVGQGSLRGLAGGDLDGDGAFDIVAIDDSLGGGLTVLLGSGDGGFTHSGRVRFGNARPHAVSLADLDDNGTLEAIISTDDGRLVFSGNGDGTFAEPTNISGVGEFESIVDIDGDGNLDLVAGAGQQAQLLLGNGDQTFDPAVPVSLTTDFNSMTTSLVVADVTGDGLSDLIAALRESGFSGDETGKIIVLAGQADGTFAPLVDIAMNDGNQPMSVAANDLDGDGDLDLVIINSTDFSSDARTPLTVLINEGDNGFLPPSDSIVDGVPQDLTLEDLNGDGNADLLLRNDSQNRMVVMLGDGAGGFVPLDPRNADVAVGDLPRGLAVEDLNGDGVLDLVTSNAGSVSVMLGQVGGDFSAAGELALSDDGEAIALGDLDGDGDADLVVALPDLDRVAVFLGNGDGRFQPRREYAAGDSPLSLSLLDSDGDGDLDVVAANEEDASLSVLANNGDGSFPDLVLHTGADPQSIATGDVNGDGIMDLATANDRDGSLSILLGTAGGGYQSATDLPLTVTDISPSTSAGRRFTYDPDFNQLTSITDDLGRRTLFQIDPATGNTLAVTEVIGLVDSESEETDDLVTRFTYTDAGLVDTVVDPLGHTTDNDYDEYGRLIAITSSVGTADQASRHFEYDAAGNVTAVVDENGGRTEFNYDPMNLVTEIRDPDPDGGGPLESPVTALEYDPRGNLTQIIDAEGSQSTTAYDPLDRPIRVTDAAGKVTHFVYDAVGNLARTIDPLGAVTEHRYDARNRLVETVDPAGGRTTFRYDADNHLTRVIDPVGNATHFGYDSRGRLVRETDPLGRSITNEYDAADNLVRRTDRNGRVTVFAHDEIDRLVTETWLGTDGTPENVIEYAYDKASNVLSIADAFSVLHYTHDHRGRVTHVDNTGAPEAPAVSLEYTYDALGNVLSVTDTIDGTASGTTEYAYDALNRATRLTQSGNGVAEKRVDLAYNRLGQLASIDRFADASGTDFVVGTEYVYDELNRLTELRHQNRSEELAFYEFTYDTDSRITSIRDIDGLTTYSYDATDQLLGAARGEGDARGDESYRYDANGNRVSSHLHGDGYVTGPGNRLLSDGTYDYQYDHEGNLARRTEIASGNYRELEWDHRNRLIVVTDKLADSTPTQRVEFIYDALDRRISKAVDEDPTDAVDSAITHFVYDREDVILDFIDTDGAGPEETTLDKRYFHGPGIDQVFAQETAETDVQWLLTDHLGSTHELADDTGSVINHFIFDSFGNLTERAGAFRDTRYLFTGREWDSEIETYYYRTRHYDATFGEFISEDWLRFAAGDANIYRYVVNNPLSFSDPTGQAIGSQAANDCDESFLDRVIDNFIQTNNALPGVATPTGSGLLTGGIVAEALGTQTFISAMTEIIFNSTVGAIVGGTGTSAGALLGSAAVTSAINGLLIGAAFEAGVLVGSVINVGIDEIWDAVSETDANECGVEPPSCS